MANTKTEQDFEKVLKRRDLIAANFRWLFASQICWNYERMMSTGYLYSILPTLRKLYKTDDDLKDMMNMHNQFFNTNPMVGGLILGMDMAIEEREKKASKEVVTGLKTGLMGPFAGVGDTIFGVILPTIFGSIAAYMGLQGNVTGVVIWVLVNILVVGARFTLLPLGYKQGAKLVTEFADRLNALTDAAILLGVTVVGALIPTVIKATVPFVYKSGKVELKMQDMLDQIMPSLVPVLLVALIYALLGHKKMTSTKAILLVMVIAIILFNLKILGIDKMGLTFFDKARELTEELEKTQAESIHQAAKLVADSIMNDGIIQAFGSGHSYAAAIEVCGRAGGLIPSKVIMDPAGGYYESIEGVGSLLTHRLQAKPNDIFFLISNSGRNPMGIELAEWIKSQGCKLIVVTALDASQTAASRHSSGKLLYEFADVILDNRSVQGDAALELEGLEGKVCGTSSFSAVLLLQQTIYEAVELMLEKGYTPPVYRSANIDGGYEYNFAIEDKFADRIFHL